ncbi:hypothetical protein WJX72_004404 [[Myrmecia] bisecta]|uniref:Uncharacterized protein n=1 Tax=[Myrmecia] bisecta TaxID=41462 RepID=A0AAW1P3V9_9CHLO
MASKVVLGRLHMPGGPRDQSKPKTVKSPLHMHAPKRPRKEEEAQVELNAEIKTIAAEVLVAWVSSCGYMVASQNRWLPQDMTLG